MAVLGEEGDPTETLYYLGGWAHPATDAVYAMDANTMVWR